MLINKNLILLKRKKNIIFDKLTLRKMQLNICNTLRGNYIIYIYICMFRVGESDYFLYYSKKKYTLVRDNTISNAYFCLDTVCRILQRIYLTWTHCMYISMNRISHIAYVSRLFSQRDYVLRFITYTLKTSTDETRSSHFEYEALRLNRIISRNVHGSFAKHEFHRRSW